MKKRCEHCGAFTDDLETVALDLVRALKAVSHLMMLEDEGEGENDKVNISRLFEYLALPLDNAINTSETERLEGGAK